MYKLLIIILLLIPFVLFPTASHAKGFEKSPAKSTKGQIIIKFKPTISQSDIKKKFKEYNMRLIEKNDELSALTVEVPVGKEDTIINKLKKEKLILYAERNYIYRYEDTPSPTSETDTHSLTEQINLRRLWKLSKGQGIKVAIVDSGFEIDHPAFAGKEFATKNFSKEKTLEDKIGHGTRTAGIIAARNTPQGIEGICPNCEMLLIKLGDDPNSHNVANGIVWATKKGAKVINLSIITEGYSDLTEEAINYAWEKGVVIIAAAGNQHSSDKVYPAAYNHVLAVASVDNTDHKASFSNYGSWVALAAPGVNIYTTHKDAQYGYVSGTSISSPIVAGVAALIWDSKYGTSNKDVVERLCDTADKIEGTNKYWRCGLIDVESALTSTASEKQKETNLIEQILKYIRPS